MAHRGCKNDANNFCYICGSYTFKESISPISPLIKARYYDYFKMKIGDQEKTFAPHSVCKKCNSNLSMWSANKLKKLPFSSPMAWREQKNHVDDCYFCMTHILGFNKRTAKHIVYPNLESAIRPIPYEKDEEGPVPSKQIVEEEESASESDLSYVGDVVEQVPSKINQEQLDNLVRKLKLSKKQARLAGSMLKEFGVLDSETKFAFYKDRDLLFKDFFKQSEEHWFVYCCDIPGLVMKLGIQSDVKRDWWLFIDGSVSSVKAVLLHRENVFPAIPIGYSREAKES